MGENGRQDMNLEECMRKSREALAALLEFSRRLAGQVSLGDIYRVCNQTALDLLGLDFSTLMTVTGDGRGLVIRDAIGFPDSMIGSFTLVDGQGLSTHVFRNGQPGTVLDFTEEDRFEVPPVVFEQGITSAICVPMFAGDERFGVLIGHTRTRRVFTADEIDLYQSFANQAAVAIKNVLNVEAMRVSQARYEAIFNATGEAIFIHDGRTGRVLDVNRAMLEMYGCSREEVLAAGPEAFCAGVPPYTAGDASEWLRRAMEEGHQTFEWRARRRNGELFWVEVSLTRTEINGEPRVIAVVRDIGERKRMEEQMRQVQKLESLGVLAGGIAHDFNNLLMAILGNADLALAEMSPVSPGRENIEAIETTARRAAELCRQMLAYSGRGKFVIEAIDLNALVQEMTHMLEVSISKKVVIKMNLAANLPRIDGDPGQIRQVVMNLVINGSEAIGERSGVVSISTGAMDCDAAYLEDTFGERGLVPGTYVFLEVADTGCGMDEATMARIFDPFFSTKFTGRGLGMAAVLGIVRGHSGAIRVYSEKDRGTTIKILFPASRIPAVEEEAPVVTEAGIEGSGRLILMVDDEPTVRTVGAKMLERLGFRVITAGDGAEALELFAGRCDDIWCVLMDLTMPRMDGEEAFREMRRIKRDVRVILSSGYNEQEVSQKFVGKGLAGFIQKPFQLKDLREALSRID